MISSRDIARALYMFMEDGRSAEEISERFATYVTHYGLEARVPYILEILDSIAVQEDYDATLHVFVAGQISTNVIETIKERLSVPEGATVTEATQKELIGGVCAIYGDRYLDASALRHISNIKEHIINA
ncbi:MAG: F0F1 ATP synthase subunit delta [bacterium]|nr:F0F1 ATP synthase subunit delta [bacterium]